MAAKHLYRKGARKRQIAKFRRKYGARGAYVYGAVVGKVKRERAAKRKRRR